MNNFEDKSAKQLHKAVTKEKQCRCICHCIDTYEDLPRECSHCLPQSLKIDAELEYIMHDHNKIEHPTHVTIKQLKSLFLSLIKQNAGQLRQWLNEDRITDPKKIVTTEQILHWLNIEGKEV